MKNYLELMQKILNEGDVKQPSRENMPKTKELFGEMLVHDLQDGFPLLTTKKMYVRGVIEELLWFLRGSTNVSELIKKDTNIWNEDGYKFYRKSVTTAPLDYDSWVNRAKEAIFPFQEYDLGKIYGYLWRHWGQGYTNEQGIKESEGIDQIKALVNTIIKTPDSRYQIVSAWNPSAIQEGVALPSCHVLWQTRVRSNAYIDLNIYQRSCDHCLGVPYNIASYAFLVHILAKLTGYQAGILKWIGGSVHIYENQVEEALEQLKRTPKPLPTLEIANTKAEELIHQTLSVGQGYSGKTLTEIFTLLNFESFLIKQYDSYPTIKYKLSTGLKLEPYNTVW